MKSGKTQVNGYVERDLKRRIQAVAKAEGRSVSNLVSFLLIQGVNTLEMKQHHKGSSAA